MNRSELRDSVYEKGYPEALASAINAAISTIDRRIQGSRRWPWLETNGTQTTTSGDSDVSFPSDARSIDAVYLSRDDETFDFEFRPYREVREYLQRDEAEGTPRYWSLRARELVLYPIPDDEYTLTIEYVLTPPAIDDDTDEPLTPDEYQDVYVWGAVAQLAVRERDWSTYNAATAEYNSIVRDMHAVVGVEQRQNARHVPRSEFWNTVHTPPGLG